jgi:hypothetical protein
MVGMGEWQWMLPMDVGLGGEESGMTPGSLLKKLEKWACYQLGQETQW